LKEVSLMLSIESFPDFIAELPELELPIPGARG
jgi:hypothetical protein